MLTSRWLRFGLLVAWLAAVAAPARAAEGSAPAFLPVPTADTLRSKLRTEHPRLLATAADFAALKERIGADETLRDWHARLRERAAAMMTSPPSRYEIPDGLRLLATSRRVLGRVYTLALLDRLEGKPEYAARAWTELEEASRFPDWNPRHFLDTAEMTHAFAIGLDWLHDRWTPAQRTTLQRALIDFGLRLGVESYRGGKSYGWWTTARHNWNQVCNGGIGLGALAVADVEPALAFEFLTNAIRSIQLPMREYGPDGAWAEGPGYWQYATRYNVAFLAALESACGTDFGLATIPGFAEAGLFPVYLTGPLDRTFNYADGGDHAIRAPEMFWFARRFQMPALARTQRALAAPDPLDLLWYDARLAGPTGTELPLDRHFRGADIVTMRSAWGDRDAVFIGFKAGDNKANHSHLDLGSFVLDADGVRWGIDLGADDYNLPAYFGKERWNYYRLRAEGHNTLVLDPGKDPGQDPKAAGRIESFRSDTGESVAIADLTPAYAGQANLVKRTVALRQRRVVAISDRVEAAYPLNTWWFFHTQAEVTLAPDGRSATLSQRGREMRVRLESSDPVGAHFQVMDARPLSSSPDPAGQNRNQGVRKLAVFLINVKHVNLDVVFEPVRQAAARQ